MTSENGEICLSSRVSWPPVLPRWTVHLWVHSRAFRFHVSSQDKSDRLHRRRAASSDLTMMQKNTPPTSPPDMEAPEEEEEEEEEDLDAAEIIELDDNEEVEDSGDEDDGHNDEEDDMVIPDSTDDADLIFTRHTGSVFACTLDPKSNGKLALTGGEDDKAYVWDTGTGDVVLECTGHKDSVICTGFSHDGVYAATGDMSGVVKVWKMSTKQLVWSFEAGDLSWLSWHHGSHVLLGGSIAGETWMWRIPSGECKIFPGHGERNECGAVLPDGKRAVIGYSDGEVKVFDLKAGSSTHHMVSGGGSGSGGASAGAGLVTCLDTHHDNTLVLAGSTDGNARIFNTHTGKILATLPCGPDSSTQPESSGDSSSSASSVEAVSFCPPNLALGTAATATVDGQVCVWDVSTHTRKHLCQQDAGVVKIQWDPTPTPVLYTAGLDGVIRVFDSRTGSIEGTLDGHTANILDMALSRDGSTLVTASDDKTSRVFSLHKVDR